MTDDFTVVLQPWNEPPSADDPDANFKIDLALYAHVDPLATIRNLSENLHVPVGALCHYVLAKWATGGSGGLLELGPTMTRRLNDVCDQAEADGTNDVWLAAYEQLRQMLDWLRHPLDHPEVYE